MITALVVGAITLSAQTSQVATLSHDGQITTHYSANALKDAYAAAVDGDIITLSSGTFTTPYDISKQITLRGAGMMPNKNSSIIVGMISFKDKFDCNIEGIFFNDEVRAWGNSIFSKCYFKYQLNCYEESNLKIVHCIINYLWGYNATLINSAVKTSSSLTRTSITNCYISINDVGGIESCNLNNCVVHDTINYGYFSASTMCNNCYYFGADTNPFKNMVVTTNVVNNDLTEEADVFKDLMTYQLNDDLAAQWIGSDGTQVGIYGGSFSFDPTPTSPQITKFDVAKKTTADGLLSVDIEVKAN